MLDSTNGTGRGGRIFVEKKCRCKLTAIPHVDIINDGYTEYRAGGGMHVSLSPTDLHNTAVAAGPDFRRGFILAAAIGQRWILFPRCSG